ncbi:enoyl-CoA hydratase/isomerase family protein [Ancylobacter sp. VNQ12]|uniref:enoyl-CoA hydratase/isomerase family protein n=1 Tax=Ancylobacter sp. VNQ12 TaxID=3400920 RepID=UPI003C06AC91
MTSILTETVGALGHITLNRPATLNALTLEMVREITLALTGWEKDAAVAAILLDGAGERAFCAGGDIRTLYDAARAGEWSAAETFFREEYPLNAYIARYAKPIVAVMDGITMGGGIGLGGHASHRIVTERSTLAMPETRIGFFPDVGGTYLLGTAPGELGTHIALTAGRLDAAGAITCRLADVLVPSGRLAELPARLASCRSDQDVADTLEDLAVPPSMDGLAADRAWIDRCYAGDSAEAILAALSSAPEPGARKAAEEIAGNSPSAVKITLHALREARRLGRLEPCLDQEFRIGLSAVRHPDFVEGVRAAVVDKDRRPRWFPASLDAVSDEDVAGCFQPVGSTRELGLAG